MQHSKVPLYKDPDYIQGQIESLKALVLGLANLLTSKEDFRDQSLQRLDSLRTALLSEPVAEARLQAIDDCEAWVKKVA